MSVIKTEKLSLILSQYAGISEEEASRFLSIFASVISAHVKNGEDVEVQGLGRFIVIDTKQSEMRRVALMLSEIMRDEVNSPFSFFEPYVINKGKEIPPGVINDEASNSIVVIEEDSVGSSDLLISTHVEEDSLSTSSTIVSEIEEHDVTDSQLESDSSEYVCEPASNEPKEDDTIETTTSDPQEKPNKHRHRLVYYFISLVLILATILYYFNRSSVQEIDAHEETAIVADSALNEKADSSSIIFLERLLIDSLGVPVKITASESDRLTSLSQKIFGKSEFWPYFYEVNKDNISSPSAELGGLELFVPNQSYFDIDTSSPQSIEKAKNFGIEIIKN